MSAETCKAWKERNKERIRAYDRAYYHEVKKHAEVRRSNPDVRCFCGIRLASRFGGRCRRRYCDSCANSPRFRKLLARLYVRRSYARKMGLAIPELTLDNLYKDEEIQS